MKVVNLSRRRFMQSSAVLVVGAGLPLGLTNSITKAGVFRPSVYLALGDDGAVLITAHRSEMGQGIRTALTQIIADELDADWSRVKVQQATGDKIYGDQNTDGSQSIRLFYDVLRHAGGSARRMLVEAAAAQWGVETSDCKTENHRVHNIRSGEVKDYADLVEDASKREVPQKVTFKDRRDHRFIGKDQVHIDIDDVVNGRAIFGADIKLEGMLYATLRRCPWVGGGLAKEPKIEFEEGYIGYEIIKPPIGAPVFTPLGSLAILAEDTYTSMKVAQSVDIEWTASNNQNFDSKAFTQALRDAVQQEGKKLFDHGNVDAAFDGAGKEVEAIYETPFLSHAPMEPPVSVASVVDGFCEVWAPVQDPQSCRDLVAGYLGYPVDQVRINVTMLGGAFGRKSKPDFVLEAVELSKRRKVPVRVQWSREDDIKHDYYHAASAQYHKAILGENGMPEGWLQRTAFPAIGTTFSEAVIDPSETELEMGFSNLPYRVSNQRFEFSGIRPGARIGWLRSVCNIFHSFSSNSFVDEMAVAAGQDPLEYRLQLLGEENRDYEVPGMQAPKGHEMDLARIGNVIRRVSNLSEWNRDRGPGRGLGLAVHHSFRSYVAVVLDVTVDQNNYKVNEAFVVLDCGTFINPNTCIAQMEGAVVFGLSLAMIGEITLEQGRVVQGNFDDYPVLRIGDCPEIQVELVESEELPAGVGEPGVPPVAPALVNAIYSASGKRVRKLPIDLA